MGEKENKKEGPSCACGKEDLYEVWLKNEKTKKEASCTIIHKKEDKDNSLTDSNKKENQKE